MSAAVRPRLLVVWLVVLALAAIIAVIENRGEDSSGTGNDAPSDYTRMLLPAPVEQLGAIEIGHAGTMHRFERDAGGTWFYHGAHGAAQAGHMHVVDPIAAQRIEKALAALGRARIERELPYSPQSTQFGVHTPQMIVLVYAPNDGTPMAQYAIGDIAPDTFSRYVLPLGSAKVVTVANYQIENLVALIGAVAGPGPAAQAH